MENSTVIALVIVAIVAIAIMVSSANARALARAKKAYQDSLAALSHDPANARLKTNTLSLGRFYANLTRDKKGVAMFDEVALMNDINAACAAAMHVAPSHHGSAQAQVAPTRVSATEAEERLTALAGLQSKGLITEAEFQQRRSAILNAI